MIWYSTIENVSLYCRQFYCVRFSGESICHRSRTFGSVQYDLWRHWSSITYKTDPADIITHSRGPITQNRNPVWTESRRVVSRCNYPRSTFEFFMVNSWRAVITTLYTANTRDIHPKENYICLWIVTANFDIFLRIFLFLVFFFL